MKTKVSILKLFENEAKEMQENKVQPISRQFKYNQN